MVALLPAENLETGRLSDFDLILASQFQRGLDGLGAAAGEVDGAAAKMFSSEREQFLRIFFRNRGRELAGVDKFELRGLLRHGGGNFRHTMADEVDCGGSGEIEIFVAVGVPYVDAFAANGCGKVFAEGAAKNCGTRENGGGGHI